MEILVSNFPPIKTYHKSFSDKFNALLPDADKLDIAVGYISEKSLEHLTECIYKQGNIRCNIIIGMHYFDKFTHAQFAIAKETEKFLNDNQLGSVRLVTSFPFQRK